MEQIFNAGDKVIHSKSGRVGFVSTYNKASDTSVRVFWIGKTCDASTPDSLEMASSILNLTRLSLIPGISKHL